MGERMEQVERRRYHFQTTMPETIVDDLRDRVLRLVGVAIGLGDDVCWYVVECVACGSGALLDATEAVWGLEPLAGG